MTQKPPQSHDISHFMDILVCPISLTPLIYDPASGELISYQSRYAYRLVDGQAMMRISDARRLTDAETDQIAARLTE
jgi:uncharacterized protein YbaR (Trm112 family)